MIYRGYRRAESEQEVYEYYRMCRRVCRIVDFHYGASRLRSVSMEGLRGRAGFTTRRLATNECIPARPGQGLDVRDPDGRVLWRYEFREAHTLDISDAVDYRGRPMPRVRVVYDVLLSGGAFRAVAENGVTRFLMGDDPLGEIRAADGEATLPAGLENGFLPWLDAELDDDIAPACVNPLLFFPNAAFVHYDAEQGFVILPDAT